MRDELNRANDSLAAAHMELRHLDETKSMFMSVAAHEVANPLTALKGYLQLFASKEFGDFTPDQHRSPQVMLRNVERLIHINSNILDVARLELGELDLDLQSHRLSGLVSAAIESLQPQLDAMDQRVVVHAPKGFPDALCDGSRTVQILANLISNASKYSPAGALIEVGIQRSEEPRFLELTVVDQGVGISAEDQTQIFGRFFRGREARGTGTRGTGLGLYICRLLIQLHGGEIWFDSDTGSGSTFHFTLLTGEWPRDLWPSVTS